MIVCNSNQSRQEQRTRLATWKDSVPCPLLQRRWQGVLVFISCQTVPATVNIWQAAAWLVRPASTVMIKLTVNEWGRIPQVIYLWTPLPSKWHWKDEARSKNIHFAGRTTWLSPKLATWERGGVKFTWFQFGVNSSDCKQQSNYQNKNQISLTSCTDCSICPGIYFNNIREGRALSKRWLDQHSTSDIFFKSGSTF